jgi:Family of unknown function (DUF7002)
MVDPATLGALYPTLYHMAEGGSWPAIRERGLLSTRAIVDLYQPGPELRAEILSVVRRRSITLTGDKLGPVTIRDQGPLKFLTSCLKPDTTPRQFLDALNGRVFFWLSCDRLHRLLNAKRYRAGEQTVLHVDTTRLLGSYGDRVQLAPYNTGDMHVPTSPQRGADVFVDVADYPYELWRAKRGSATEAVVELTIPYAVPDIASLVTRVETWQHGAPISVLFGAPGGECQP